MTKWEYKTVKLETGGWWGGVLDTDQFDGMLNQLGQEGWELVTAFDTNKTQGVTRDAVAVFKRPRR